MMTNEEIDARIAELQDGDSNDAEIEGLTEIIRELQAERLSRSNLPGPKVRGEFYVELKGTIPVTVQVCLTEDDGYVNRVIAHDEDFKYDAPTETSEEDAEIAALRGRAHEVAEASLWPAWEWGA